MVEKEWPGGDEVQGNKDGEIQLRRRRCSEQGQTGKVERNGKGVGAAKGIVVQAMMGAGVPSLFFAVLFLLSPCRRCRVAAAASSAGGRLQRTHSHNLFPSFSHIMYLCIAPKWYFKVVYGVLHTQPHFISPTNHNLLTFYFTLLFGGMHEQNIPHSETKPRSLIGSLTCIY